MPARGHLALILHAHLPFVRHPEHEKFLEENWLYEAITECYLPLIQIMDGWLRDGMETRLTLTLSPTLCFMLLDPLLQSRYEKHLDGLIELSEREIHRTYWDKNYQPLAWVYHHRFNSLRDTYRSYARNIVGAFRKFQEAGRLEIITTAATHAVLPLLAGHPASIRAQILTARDHYRACFGTDPHGIWLPECAYTPEIEPFLQEAGIRWFLLDTHGVLLARPRPRYGVFAPIFTPNGLGAFGRDFDSATQVWSKQQGYPGDPRYRDFYRDIGFDLDFDYVKPYLPDPQTRTFTGIKYHSISGKGADKTIYDRQAALLAAADHAGHFLSARMTQVHSLSNIMDRPPLLVSPYDAELFGHWWYEGPEFLDYFVRKTVYDQNVVQLTTPWEYLRFNPTQQVARPSPSSWGEEGYWKVWLNDNNQWIYPHLDVAATRMEELVRELGRGTPTTPPAPSIGGRGEIGRSEAGRSEAGRSEVGRSEAGRSEVGRSEAGRSEAGRSEVGRTVPGEPSLTDRALKQAARELLLAQASDWPFIMRTGTSPDYARQRIKDHILRFTQLYDQLKSRYINEPFLASIESADNLFPDINYRYWGTLA